jgi:hypothetical protein
MGAPLEFDPEQIKELIYAEPEPVETLVKAIMGAIASVYPGEEVTADQIGQVMDSMAQDAMRKPPRGPYKGFLEEEAS